MIYYNLQLLSIQGSDQGALVDPGTKYGYYGSDQFSETEGKDEDKEEIDGS